MMCKGPISVDSCRPPSFDGSGSHGKTATSRTAEVMNETKALLDGSMILTPMLTLCRSALSDTTMAIGSYLQFITLKVCVWIFDIFHTRFAYQSEVYILLLSNRLQNSTISDPYTSFVVKSASDVCLLVVNLRQSMCDRHEQLTTDELL